MMDFLPLMPVWIPAFAGMTAKTRNRAATGAGGRTHSQTYMSDPYGPCAACAHSIAHPAAGKL